METGAVGRPQSGCLYCTTPFLEEASYCYQCGHPRQAVYRALGCGKLLAVFFLGLLSTGLLSFGGCSVFFGMNERGAEGMGAVGLVCIGVGFLTTLAMVRSLKQ